MRRLAMVSLAILGLVPTAEALTVRDVIELSRAGLGEEVLLAMIEVDGSIFQIDPNTLKSLKQAGVPERVIVAMVRSGRQPVPAPAPVTPPAVEEPRSSTEPQVVVIDHHDDPRPREVVVPVPIYVPVDVTRVSRHRGIIRSTPIESTYVPFQAGPPLHPPQRIKREPVYWGFGGKLRPDAWHPDGHKRQEHRGDEIRQADGDKRLDKK